MLRTLPPTTHTVLSMARGKLTLVSQNLSWGSGGFQNVLPERRSSPYLSFPRSPVRKLCSCYTQIRRSRMHLSNLPNQSVIRTNSETLLERLCTRFGASRPCFCDCSPPGPLLTNGACFLRGRGGPLQPGESAGDPVGMTHALLPFSHFSDHPLPDLLLCLHFVPFPFWFQNTSQNCM